MSRFPTRFKHRQHTENITDDDECPIHLFNYPWEDLYYRVSNRTDAFCVQISRELIAGI